MIKNKKLREKVINEMITSFENCSIEEKEDLQLFLNTLLVFLDDRENHIKVINAIEDRIKLLENNPTGTAVGNE